MRRYNIPLNFVPRGNSKLNILLHIAPPCLGTVVGRLVCR